MRAIHAEVSGLVQGVYFRASTVREARRLALEGWVRNLSSGSVEVWAQGTDDALDRIKQFLDRGPEGAVVETVSFEVVETDPRLTSFNVRY
ncbi:MAG: acylphosphatase [Actinomycetota bacterium]